MMMKTSSGSTAINTFPTRETEAVLSAHTIPFDGNKTMIKFYSTPTLKECTGAIASGFQIEKKLVS